MCMSLLASLVKIALLRLAIVGGCNGAQRLMSHLCLMASSCVHPVPSYLMCTALEVQGGYDLLDARRLTLIDSVMALGHYMRKIGQVQGYLPGGKHPMTTGSKMTPRSTQRENALGRTPKHAKHLSLK